MVQHSSSTEPQFWTLRIGKFRGVELRIHAAMLFTLLMGMWVVQAYQPSRFLETVLLGLGAGTLSILTHELGHLFALRRFGGKLKTWTLTPIGNVRQPELPIEPQYEFSYALAGPMASFFTMICSAILLTLISGRSSEIFHSPFQPYNLLTGSSLIVGLKLLCWMSGLLTIVNIFPALPFDSGFALVSLLTPLFGHNVAVRTVSRCMVYASVGLILLAVLLPVNEQNFPPTWLTLVLFSGFLLFQSANHTAELGSEDEPPMWLLDDVSQSKSESPTCFTTAPFQGHSPLANLRSDVPDVRSPHWIDDIINAESGSKRVTDDDVEIDDEKRLDTVLEQVNQVGIDGISHADREFLHRTSRQFRKRNPNAR